MSDPTVENSPSPSDPPADGGGPGANERRDFFNEAMREILLPFAVIIERRIAPILDALEQIPEQAERLANTNFGILDQPRSLPPPPRQPRIAIVDHDLCLRSHGEPCTLCLDICPIDSPPTALFIGTETGRVYVRKNSCIGCGQCESRCPTEPRAITFIPYTPPIDPIIA